MISPCLGIDKFPRSIEEIMYDCPQAHLGLATTRELLAELSARFLIAGRDDLLRIIDTVTDATSDVLLNYRTVDS